MSQQPQPRPWFRLASLARPSSAPPPPPPAPAQTQAPALRPPFIRPTLTQTFAPPPPTQAPTQPPPPPRAPTPPSPPQAPIQTLPSPPPTRPLSTAPSSPAIPSPRATNTPPPKTPPTANNPSNPSPKPSPTMSASYVPQSPKPKISAPSSPMSTRLISPTPSPPSPPPLSRAATPPSPIITANAARVLTPPLPSPQIPKYHEPKTPSPRTKPLSPPPSPLTLPSPQLVNSDHEHNNKLIHPETEQKIVMVHNNILEKTKPVSRENHYNDHHTTPTSQAKKEKVNHNINPHKKMSDSEDMGMSVITLAGENRGAIMELTPSHNPRNGHIAINRHHKNGNNDKSWSDGEKSASDSKGKGKHKDKKPSAKTTPFHAYTNSNVQGVNNSIMYNSSCTHNDPGVHLSVSRKPKDPVHPHHVEKREKERE